MIIPETLRQASEALQQASAALTTVAQAMEDAPGPGTLRTGGWIVDRMPTEEDGEVAVPIWPGTNSGGFEIVTWCYVNPGTPWAPVDEIPGENFLPATLDRNGWIRSRLPTVEDAGSNGHVPIPVGHGGTNASINYRLIVPGQPWAPWDSSPGRFEK